MCIYLIAWIFIGNFILLNLFLAILIDAFLEQDEEEINPEDLAAIRERKKARALARKRKGQKKQVIMAGVQKALPPSKVLFGQAQTTLEEELEDIEDLDEEQVKGIFKKEGYMAIDDEEKIEINYFEGIYAE